MNSPSLPLLGLLSFCLLAPPRADAEPAALSADLAQTITAAAAYDSGQDMSPLRHLEDLARAAIADPAQRPALEAGLTQLISGDATFEAKRFACQYLGILGSAECVPALAKLLANDTTTGMACLALEPNPAPTAGEALCQALVAARGLSQVQIINALGNRREAPAAAPLARLTQSADVEVATAAIAALGKIGDEPARHTLATLPKPTDPRLQAALTDAILRTAEQLVARGDAKAAARIYTGMLAPTQPPNLRRGALRALLALDRDGGEQRILKVLRAADPVLSPVAIAAMGRVSTPGAAGRFARTLPALPAAEQVWMIEALAQRPEADARAALQAQLTATDTPVRRAAIRALGARGGVEAVAPLLTTLGRATDDAEYREVEAALAGLAGDQATDLALIDRAPALPEDKRGYVFFALAERGSRPALPLLLGASESANPAVVQPALRALTTLATPADAGAVLAKLVELKAPAARVDAEDATRLVLLKVPDPAARSALVCRTLGALPAGSIEARCSLLQLLPACGDQQALDALTPASADADARVRDAATRALADWPTLAAWEALRHIYEQPDSPAHRALALRALVRLQGEANAQPSPGLIDRYQQLLAGARDDGDYKLVLGALGAATQPEALPLATGLLARSSIRAEAAQAVRRIAEAVRATNPQAAEAALEQLK